MWQLFGYERATTGTDGYVLTKLSWWQRISFMGGGLGLVTPGRNTDLLDLTILIMFLVKV